MTLTLCLINFLEQFTELREFFYFLVIGLLWKDITPERPDGKEAYGKVWREQSFHAL